MINEVFGYKPLKEVTVVNCEVTSSVSKSRQFISGLQIGDTIEGVLVQEEGKIILKLDNNIKLSINLLDQVEIGKLLSFIVLNKQGNRLVLKPNLSDTVSNKQLIDQVINELKLPNQLVMKSIIGQFIAKGLPLDKESLLAILKNHKTYDVPTEILVNLKNNESPITLSQVTELASLKSGGTQIILDTFEMILTGLKDNSQLEQLAHDLGNTVSLRELHKAIKDIVPNSSVEEYLKEWFSSDFTTKQLSSNINDKTQNQVVDDHISLLKTFIKTMLKTTLEVNVIQIKQDLKESQKIIGTYKSLEEIIKQFQKINLSDEGKEKLEQIHQMAQTIRKHNIEAEYFYFPFILNKDEGKGELYFFRPKQKQGTMNEQMYIVMALDMPCLRKVEVHIEQIQKAVNMTIKVENEIMKRLMEGSLDKLCDELKVSGYELNQLSISLLKDPNMPDTRETGLYHMDLKV